MSGRGGVPWWALLFVVSASLPLCAAGIAVDLSAVPAAMAVGAVYEFDVEVDYNPVVFGHYGELGTAQVLLVGPEVLDPARYTLRYDPGTGVFQELPLEERPGGGLQATLAFRYAPPGVLQDHIRFQALAHWGAPAGDHGVEVRLRDRHGGLLHQADGLLTVAYPLGVRLEELPRELERDVQAEFSAHIEGIVDVYQGSAGSARIELDAPAGADPAAHVAVALHDGAAWQDLNWVGDELEIAFVFPDQETDHILFRVTVDAAAPSGRYGVDVAVFLAGEKIAEAFGEAFVGLVEACRVFSWGWNLVSLPVEAADPSVDSVFGSIPHQFRYVYGYDAATKDWVKRTPDEATLTHVTPLGGYWMWAPSTGTQVCVEGAVMEGERTVLLDVRGWHMIGVPYAVAWGPAEGGSIAVRLNGEVKTLEEAVAADWLYYTIWEYDTEAERWSKPTLMTGATLEPWKGYWVWTGEDNLEFIFNEAPNGVQAEALSMGAVSTTLADPGNPPLPQAPITFSADQIVVAGYPNPVTGGQQVTFAVQGPMAVFAEAVRVQVLDVSGRTVFAGEGAGAQVSWGLEDRSGRTVANGVYLYVAEIKLHGEWLRVAAQRLLVLR